MAPFDKSHLRIIDSLPEFYSKAVIESFSNIDDELLTVVNEYQSLLIGVDSTLSVAEFRDGGLDIPISHYNYAEMKIYMDESKDTVEYSRTFRHEFGHFIDHALGDASSSTEFEEAFKKDVELYNVSHDDGIKRLNLIKKEISDNIHAFASEYVTDIISALTHNDTAFIRTYAENAVQTSEDDLFYYEKMEGVGMSGHSNSYWDFGPNMSQQKEIFANLFAIRVENNPIVREFVTEFFPNTSVAFNRIVKNAI